MESPQPRGFQGAWATAKLWWAGQARNYGTSDQAEHKRREVRKSILAEKKYKNKYSAK